MLAGRALRLKSYLTSLSRSPNVPNVYAIQNIKINGIYCKDTIRHENGSTWQITNLIASDINKADRSKVQLENVSIPKYKEQLKKVGEKVTEGTLILT